MSVDITWLGHAAFQFVLDGRSVLVDPFLTGNPLAATSADQPSAEIIFLSHAHGDHTGDTLVIAQRTGAKIVANNEIATYYGRNKNIQTHGQNPGGSFNHGFVTAKWTVAHHSSSFPDGTYGGEPNGFILTCHDSGLKIYFAGDTSLFGDMKLIGDHGIDAVPVKQALEQQELGVQILAARRVVDDRDACERRVAALPSPLLPEHVHDRRFVETPERTERCGLGTARALRPRQYQIEQATAGVGVDLDQARAIGVEMKVVTEKRAARAERVRGYRRRPGGHCRGIRRQRNDTVDRRDELLHAAHVQVRHEYDRGGIEVRSIVEQRPVKVRVVCRARQLGTQPALVYADARAVSIQDIGERQ